MGGPFLIKFLREKKLQRSMARFDSALGIKSDFHEKSSVHNGTELKYVKLRYNYSLSFVSPSINARS